MEVLLLAVAFSFALGGFVFQDHKSDEREMVPLPQHQAPFQVSAEFLVKRIDSLEQSLHYLRSGISILIAIFTEVIVLFWNTSATLTILEQELLILSAIIVVFGILALLFSFAGFRIHSHDFTLEEGLIPRGQNESIYIEQLDEMIDLMLETKNRMKASITVGISLFLFFGSFLVTFPTLMMALSYSPALEGLNQVIGVLLMLDYVLFAAAAISILGH